MSEKKEVVKKLDPFEEAITSLKMGQDLVNKKDDYILKIVEHVNLLKEKHKEEITQLSETLQKQLKALSDKCCDVTTLEHQIKINDMNTRKTEEVINKLRTYNDDYILKIGELIKENDELKKLSTDLYCTVHKLKQKE